MVTRGYLTRPDLSVATPDLLPTVVAAFDASVPDFIAQMSLDFNSEAVATVEAAEGMAMALVKDQVPELPDDVLERELSELG